MTAAHERGTHDHPPRRRRRGDRRRGGGLARRGRPAGSPCWPPSRPSPSAARGHRYRGRRPGSWRGASVGGATLGLGMAALAARRPRRRALDRRCWPRVACAASVLAAAADARLGGFRLPVHHRQVNERWLDQFRPWVYGAGFGWQIGAGLVTYIKTSAVYLMIVLAALTADPVARAVDRRAVRAGARPRRLPRASHHLRRARSPCSTGASPTPGPSCSASSSRAEPAAAVLCASLLSLWAAVVVAALGAPAPPAGRGGAALAGAFPHRADLTGPATIAPIASHAAADRGPSAPPHPPPAGRCGRDPRHPGEGPHRRRRRRGAAAARCRRAVRHHQRPPAPWHGDAGRSPRPADADRRLQRRADRGPGHDRDGAAGPARRPRGRPSPTS